MMLLFRRPLWPAFAVLMLLSIDVAASAQAPAFRWWKSDAFKKELGLSTDQSARIDKIYQDTLPELQQEWEELDRLETKLSRLFEGNADEAVLARQIDRVETARANLNKSRSLMLMRMRRVLTSEQLVRFRALSQRYESDARNQAPPPHPSAPSAGSRR
jgi:Spy/CpxP family protein refolding chaperone